LDAIDQAQREFEEAMAVAGAALKEAGEAFARLRALSRAPAGPVDPMSDLMRATKVASVLGRDKSTVTAWCRQNRINGEEGFAVKLRGRWFVSRSRLEAHLIARGRAFQSSDWA
jgi:hypothetical protein